MKIGLYFGSFNPVHTGHLIIASHIANHTDLDQVWLVVSPQNPLKPSAVLLNEYDRLHLVRLAIENDPQLKVSEIEFKLPRPSYTIDTLIHLQEKYPKHTFSVIMGSDSYQNLPRWKNASLLMNQYRIIVYMRPGFPVEETEGVNLVQLNAPLLDISSTIIRNTIKSGKTIRYLVPDNVRAEIESNHYYK
ncbi:nicotinate (nicotinamide) nucleotide adenylyltransferase [Sediminibacterium ginsengisoli]|uniref:Probable nicotinate-nucleotide adenylyltransferase n=1 Tax=Sediminibacterium ginsengisoli TaxID=413434 RepID=A0A1T4ME87_9BACT|nr:nicotinate (nicotinamide) nucleotide adenylyltransferase [Sediminibacterium ginsengisoli]SJZ65233.1 nicotinate-nucleotide adenylyltransferase [Sediminibacterium ginsengisoli]